jgi:hypothetical protein
MNDGRLASNVSCTSGSRVHNFAMLAMKTDLHPAPIKANILFTLFNIFHQAPHMIVLFLVHKELGGNDTSATPLEVIYALLEEIWITIFSRRDDTRPDKSCVCGRFAELYGVLSKRSQDLTDLMIPACWCTLSRREN